MQHPLIAVSFRDTAKGSFSGVFIMSSNPSDAVPSNEKEE
jgi:hypothetical protein